MNIIFANSNKDEALDNKAILYEDQIHYINEFIDLKIIDDDTNKLVGFVISETPIFILTKNFDKYLLIIFHAFLKFKNLEKLIISYRGDEYPVDINRNTLYSYNDENQEEYLMKKRNEYIEKFGISSTDISALYSLASLNNRKAIKILEWINDIRDLYFEKVQNMNDAKYYDYDYDQCGNIPFSLQEIFSEFSPPTQPIQKKYLYAINETWQSHYHNEELVIIWDDFIKKDDIFELGKSGGKIELGSDFIKIRNYEGFLKISFKINFINSEYNRIQMQVMLSKNWDEVTDSICYAYSRSSRYVNYGSATCPPILINVKDSDELRVHTRIAYNSSKFGYTKKVSTIWRQSNIYIETI